VFLLVIFSFFISFTCYIKCAHFDGFALGFCPKCVNVYDGGGYLGIGLCTFFVMMCCCLVAHCVAPSAEILPPFLLGSFCILHVCSCFLCFVPLGRELCLRMTIHQHTECMFHGRANTLSCEHLLRRKQQMPLLVKSG
jgi:hypothetical protein